MAEEKKAVAEKSAPKKENKFLAWCKRFPKYFVNMAHELKKVTWPTKRKLLVYSGVVMAFIVIMGIVVGLIDMGASSLITWMGTWVG